MKEGKYRKNNDVKWEEMAKEKERNEIYESKA